MNDDEYCEIIGNCELDNCEDVPVITFCKRCKRVYAFNRNSGDRTEVNLKIEDLFKFIREKENEF